MRDGESLSRKYNLHHLPPLQMTFLFIQLKPKKVALADNTTRKKIEWILNWIFLRNRKRNFLLLWRNSQQKNKYKLLLKIIHLMPARVSNFTREITDSMYRCVADPIFSSPTTLYTSTKQPPLPNYLINISFEKYPWQQDSRRYVRALRRWKKGQSKSHSRTNVRISDTKLALKI